MKRIWDGALPLFRVNVFIERVLVVSAVMFMSSQCHEEDTVSTARAKPTELYNNERSPSSATVYFLSVLWEKFFAVNSRLNI